MCVFVVVHLLVVVLSLYVVLLCISAVLCCAGFASLVLSLRGALHVFVLCFFAAHVIVVGFFVICGSFAPLCIGLCVSSC